MGKGKILIIEDHEPIRAEICKSLGKYGYRTIELTRYETIIEDCVKEQADLILLDINLPVYDGYYICRKIWKRSDIPIIGKRIWFKRNCGKSIKINVRMLITSKVMVNNIQKELFWLYRIIENERIEDGS